MSTTTSTTIKDIQDMAKNMVAASSCIAVAVTVFNPLDCYRLRWQVQQDSAATMKGHLRLILRREGLFKGLWIPGIGANAIGAGFSRGIGMGCYPTVRDSISTDKTTSTMFIAGLLSGGVGYWISTPAWVIKTRLQAGKESTTNPPKGNGMQVCKDILRHKGIKGLYRGASALVVRGALVNAGNTLGYDWSKTQNCKYDIVQEGPLLHVFASVVAAFLSSTFCVPADFVMTRYQAGPQMGHVYSSVMNCARTLYEKEGPLSFFKGWTPLFVRVAPLYIFYLPVYEQCRELLGLGYMT